MHSNCAFQVEQHWRFDFFAGEAGDLNDGHFLTTKTQREEGDRGIRLHLTCSAIFQVARLIQAGCCEWLCGGSTCKRFGLQIQIY